MSALTTPQPFEDVTGRDRSGDELVSLVDESYLRRSALLDAAYRFYLTLGWTFDTAEDAATADRIRHPQVGDVVFVFDATEDDDPVRRTRAVGYLVAQRVEWSHTHEEAATILVKSPGAWYEHERPTELVWYVQYVPSAGDITRWTDAQVLAVPESVLHRRRTCSTD